MLSNPSVIASSFNWQSTRQSISFQFDQSVAQSLSPSDLSLQEVTGDDPAPFITGMRYTGGNNTVTFTFFGLPGHVLPDGNYRATISRYDVTNNDGEPMADDAVLDFFVLSGDTNHDRDVDNADFANFFSNFGTASGANYSQGDFDYDGDVDNADFAIFFSHFGETLPSPPTDPDALTVGQASADSIQLNWNPGDVSGEDGWRVQRSSDGENFDQHFNLPADATTFTDTDLADGARYWYRVRAYGNGEDTAYTPKEAATTILLTPTDLQAIPVSANEIDLSWTNNDNNQRGYNIYRQDLSTGGPFELVGTTLQDSAFPDFSVASGEQYAYYVQAFNDDAVSTPSEPVSATVLVGTPVPTLDQLISGTMNSLLDGKTASDDTFDLYSVADDANDTYVRNPDLWAAGIDLSCIPVWNSFWSSQNPDWGTWANGCLVTPRDLIQAAHFDPPMPPGTVLRFVDANNNVVEGVVADNNPDDDNDPTPNDHNGVVIPGTDIRVVQLTQDLPSNIKPAEVFPANIADLLPTLSSGIPVAMANQFRTLRIGNLDSINNYFDVHRTSGTTYDDWYSDTEEHDSGSPSLAIVGSTPILLGTWLSNDHFYGSNSGSSVSAYIDEINSVLSDGYNLTVFSV